MASSRNSPLHPPPEPVSRTDMIIPLYTSNIYRMDTPPPPTTHTHPSRIRPCHQYPSVSVKFVDEVAFIASGRASVYSMTWCLVYTGHRATVCRTKYHIYTGGRLFPSLFSLLYLSVPFLSPFSSHIPHNKT